MMYVLFICSEGGGLQATPEELDPTVWVDEMDHRNVRKFGDALGADETARRRCACAMGRCC